MMDNLKILRSLEFSLTIGCALKCDYCPQSLLLTKYFEHDKNRTSKLSFDNFKKALEQVDDGATISICGMSEPFHNPECSNMVRYAHEKGYRICFNTTLVGATKEDIEKLKDIPFENFILHIPDQENHSKFCITDEYLDLLDTVHKSIEIDYYSCHGTVHEKVESHIDSKKYAGIALGDRAGNLEAEDVQHCTRHGELICMHGSEKSTGIWAPVMFPDGTLVLCCNDYGMKHVLGNLIEQSWEDIQRGYEYQRYQNGLLDDDADILCRTCGSARPLQSIPAMKLKHMIDNGGTTPGQKEFVRKLKEAETICVYGLGKYFKDHFFNEYWQEAIQADILCDRNEALWNKTIGGIHCLNPMELESYGSLVVIVFAMSAERIKTALIDMGIDNIYTINEIFDMLEC